jgi:hypothetical protein
MLASRDAQCNALSVRPTNNFCWQHRCALLPEVVLVRRELLLASWHLASLCSLFTAIPAAGRVLTACCWSHSLVPLPLGLRTAEGTGTVLAVLEHRSIGE